MEHDSRCFYALTLGRWLRASVAIVSTLCASCSGDDVDSLWEVGPDGERSLDASRCGEGGVDAQTFRCVDDNAQGRVALGLCGDLTLDNTLTIDRRSFDVGLEPTALAVDGTTRVSSPLDVGGSFVALGGLTSTNTVDVGSDLVCGADWTASAPAEILGDAFVQGAIHASNTVTITNTLHIPSSDGLTSVTAGTVAVEPVAVSSALACGAAIDLATVGAFPSRTAHGLPPADALENVDRPTELTIGCEEYELSSVAANNTLTIRVTGPTSLLVGGDVRIAAPTVIEVDRGATLDLLIGGSLQVDNTFTVRSLAGPEAVWMGVVGDMRIAAPMDFQGRITMSRGDVAVNNTLDLRGALLARSMHVAAPVHVLDGAWLSPAGCAVLPD